MSERETGWENEVGCGRCKTLQAQLTKEQEKVAGLEERLKLANGISNKVLAQNNVAIASLECRLKFSKLNDSVQVRKLEEQLQASPWVTIKSNDDLPKESGRYYVCQDLGRIADADYEKWVRIVEYSVEHGWSGSNARTITHWQTIIPPKP